jgi:hypothetical protein
LHHRFSPFQKQSTFASPLHAPTSRGRHVAMARKIPSNRAVTRWNMRIIPVLIIGVFGVAAYAVAGHLCGALPFRYSAAPVWRLAVSQYKS